MALPRRSATLRWQMAASSSDGGHGHQLLGLAAVGAGHRRRERGRAGGCRAAGPSPGRPGWAGTAPATPRPAGPRWNRPSSSGSSSMAPDWRAARKWGSSGMRVERHEGVDGPPHLAGRAQQPEVGPAVGDDREVVEVAADDGPHDRHRLAPAGPAADGDGHARPQAADHLLLGHRLVCHASSPVTSLHRIWSRSGRSRRTRGETPSVWVSGWCRCRGPRRTRRGARRPRPTG